jgi:hypothetical protein
MESSGKRIKIDTFDNDEEAETFLDFAAQDALGLLPEMWVKILSENPQLSVHDISRMCKLNTMFRNMCRSGLIWDKIYIRQFGTEALKRATKQMPDDARARLLTHRMETYILPNISDTIGDEHSIEFSLDEDVSGGIYIRQYSSGRFSMLVSIEFKKDVLDRVVDTFSENLKSISDDWLSYTPIGGVYSWDLTTEEHLTFDELLRHRRMVIYFMLSLGFQPTGLNLNEKRQVFTGDKCDVCQVEPARYKCDTCEEAVYCSEECWKSR